MLTVLGRCVGGSDQLQLFAQEQERQKLLYSSAPQTLDTAPATPTTPSSSTSTATGNTRTPAATKTETADGGGDEDVKEDEQTRGVKEVEKSEEGLDGGRGKARRKSGARRKSTGKKGGVTKKQTQPDAPTVQPTPAECE